MDAVIDEAGRVAILEELRSRLGLKPGMVLRAEECESGISLTIPPEALDPHLQREGSVLVLKGEPEGSFNPVEFIERLRDTTS